MVSKSISTPTRMSIPDDYLQKPYSAPIPV
jgi:hypothetical protein